MKIHRLQASDALLANDGSAANYDVLTTNAGLPLPLNKEKICQRRMIISRPYLWDVKNMIGDMDGVVLGASIR